MFLSLHMFAQKPRGYDALSESLHFASMDVAILAKRMRTDDARMQDILDLAAILNETDKACQANQLANVASIFSEYLMSVIVNRSYMFSNSLVADNVAESLARMAKGIGALA